MGITRRLALTASLALVSLMFIAGTATANRSLGVEATNPITAAGPSTFEGGGINLICNLTLRASLTRANVAKAAARRLPEALIANVFNGTVGGPVCTDNLGGRADEARILNNERNPIPLRYDAFLGTLPRITGALVTALRAEFQLVIASLGISCLFRGEVPALFFEARGGQTFDQARFDERTAVRLITEPRQNELCPREGFLRATLALTPGIRVRLL